MRSPAPAAATTKLQLTRETVTTLRVRTDVKTGTSRINVHTGTGPSGGSSNC